MKWINQKKQGLLFRLRNIRYGNWFILDCEGSEWPLLEMQELWKHINAVTMEFHLWAKQGMSTGMLTERLQQCGFRVISLSPLSNTFGLLTAIKEDL